jgi:hypothetical protein
MSELTGSSHVIGVSLGGAHRARVVGHRWNAGTYPLGIDEVEDVQLGGRGGRRIGSTHDCGGFGRGGGVQGSAGHHTSRRHRKRGGDTGASPFG